MANFKVVDEEGRTVRGFETKEQAQDFADEHNEDRDPGTMEYFVKPARKTGAPGTDADKPVAEIQLDTRAQGPIICDECEAEEESVLLMEDGAIVCKQCHSDLPAFHQVSELFLSAKPLRVRGGGRKGYDVVEE